MQKFAALLAGLVAMPAFAQGESPVIVEGGVPTAVVSYADLDLSSPSGLATLDGRIHSAASRLCRQGSRTDLQTQMFEARCFKTAIASAKPQIERAIGEKSFASSGTVKVAAR